MDDEAVIEELLTKLKEGSQVRASRSPRFCHPSFLWQWSDDGCCSTM